MPPAAQPAAAPRARLDSLDVLRGLIMVLMALDHVRDFFSNQHFDPTDLARATAPLYATRWITHLCAPGFCFFAGTGAFLSRKPTSALSWFLLTRGLWLVVLELTFVHLGFFGPDFSNMGLVTIWALGWSMIALAGLIWLPRTVVAVIVTAVLAGHNALDHHQGGLVWHLLHEPGPVGEFAGARWFVAYPVLPWMAVMAAGWLFGPVMTFEAERRKRYLLYLGIGSIALFIVLRSINIYGDTKPWVSQSSPLFTFLAFINVRKYPPSLDYVLVTMGVLLLLLRALDGIRARPDAPLLVFGCVPLFYYVLHLYVIHLAAGVFFYFKYGKTVLTFSFNHPPPPDFGVNLVGVYVAWVLIVAALYLPCRWYANLKRRSRNPLLSYL